MSDVSASAQLAAVPFGVTLMRGALRVLSRTSPGAASRLAEDLFMKPRRFRAPEREKDVLARATTFDVRIGPSTNVKAWSWGSGPTVLLVHGWEGRGAQLASFVDPLVEHGYRVVTYDAPGHGMSDGNRSSLPHFTFALRSVVGAIETPHAIVAHSFGCAAATLALRDGLGTPRLVYIAPPLNPEEYTAKFAEILDLDERVLDGLRSRIEERFMRKWSDYSLQAAAVEMTAPLLVIHDRDDRETLLREGRALVEAWPGARLITTEGLGHRRILRDEQVVRTAVAFVRND
jgi:pimeloyl-ACP methyl ester carboxylesterase